MERTKRSIQTLSEKQLQVLSGVIVARNNLATMMGKTFNGARDLYKTFGYTRVLTYDHYMANYLRHDISKAVIDRPVKATWQGQLELVETQEAESTEFEDTWDILNTDFKLRSLFSRVDRLTCIGRYGVLLFGLDDATSIDSWKLPVRKGKRTLTYIKPFGENHAKISTWEDNPQDPRYGLPLLYDIQIADIASNRSTLIKVHHSRILHVTIDNLESEVYGTPVLEDVFNRMQDIEKLVGGSAEMYWRGARPGFQGMVDKDFTMTDATKEDLYNQIEEYENDLKRILINEGVELKALSQEISDPHGSMDIQLTCISAAKGIPKRILSGSERGELASSQDAGEWKTYVQSRREDHAVPNIITPFVKRMMEYGILPTVKKYTVDWLDLFSISEKERVEIGKGRSNAIREYTTNPTAIAIMPPDAFFELCLGLSKQQIELVHEYIKEGISQEQDDLIDDVNDITAPPTPLALPGSPAGTGKAVVKKPATKPMTRTK